MNFAESQYLSLIEDLLLWGDHREGRNGGVRSLFGAQMRFDLQQGFPLLTTKRVHMKSIVHELLWFIKGDTNIGYLRDNGVTIWDEWADEQGNLGPVYGKQWRAWETNRDKQFIPTVKDEQGDWADGRIETRKIDQLGQVIKGIKQDPYGRRHIVSAWNPAEIEQMALPPCHCLFQFHVTSEGRLNCQLYQRSADVFLGVPFNIASYALLTMMVAHVTGLTPGHFIHTLGDYHLYDEHEAVAREQISRTCREFPKLEIEDRKQGIDDFLYEDFRLVGYDPHPTLKAEVKA